MRLLTLTLLGILSVSTAGFGQIAEFQFLATDSQQNSITEVSVGEEFSLDVYVQDLRGLDDGGVFAAYLDIDFDTDMVELNGAIEYGEVYQDALSGELAPSGMINVGAIGFGTGDGTVPSIDPLGSAPYMVFSLPFVATAEGDLSFTGGPASDQVQNAVLVFGQNASVDSALVNYGSLNMLTAVPEPSSGLLCLIAAFGFLRRRR